MDTLLFFILGGIVGVILTTVVINKLSARATLDIDHSNPEKDVYRMNIDSINDIDRRTHLRLKINHNADLSQ